MPNESPLSEDLPDLPDEVRLDVQGKVIAAVMASPRRRVRRLARAAQRGCHPHGGMDGRRTSLAPGVRLGTRSAES
jgi:hypothetical protein